MLVANELYDGLQIFNNHGINVLPLYKVKTNNNSKKNYAESLFKNWQNTRKYNKDIIKAFKQDVKGYAIQTGAKSGVFVVDYDTKPTTNQEILQMLKDTNTLTVNTPSGGHHFYFKYNKLMATNKTGIFGNIDIRSNKGCCFFGERSDGNYTLIDNEIKECPKNILEALYEYHKIPTKKEINEAPIHEVDYREVQKYNISNKSLLYLLGFLPNEYVEDMKLWYVITAVLKKSDYYDVWDEWSKKASSKYNKKNNDFIYSKIDVNETKNDLNYIVYLVNKKLKEKKASTFTYIEVIHKEYEVLSKNNIKKINKIINQQYLTTDEYVNIDKNTILLIQSGLGTGKTFNTFKWAIENNKRILSIVHLTSLHDNQISNYNAMVNDYNTKNNTSISKISSYQNIQSYKTNSICSTINSLIKTLNYIDISEYYIYIDEIHRIISYLLHSSTLNKNRRETFKALTKALKDCKGVIGTDGDICDTTIKYLEDVGLNIHFIKNEYKSFNDVPVKFYNNHRVIENIIKKYVANNITFTLCCNTKSNADAINMYIKSLGVDDKNIKLYTSQSGDIVADVNEEWENNYIIYSPSIVEGVDRTATEPETVFVLVSSEKTIDPEQVKQQICRNRKIKEVHIGFNKMMNILDYETIDDLKYCLTENIGAFKNTFREYLDVKMNTDGEDEHTDNIYSDLFIMSSYRNNVLIGNFKYTLKQILTNTGFIINDDWQNDREKIDDYDIETKDVIPDTNVLFAKYIEGSLSNTNKFYNLMEDRRSICNLPLKDCEKYMTILTDDKNFNIYLNIRQLIKNDSLLIDKLKKDITNEYIERYYNDVIPIMIRYKTIMEKYLPYMDIYNYYYTEKDVNINDAIEIEDADFKYLKSCIRSKKSNPKTKKEFLKLMNMYIKTFYGNDMVKKKASQYRDDTNKQINYYEYTFNTDLFKQFIDLNKYCIDNENIMNIDANIIYKYQIKPYAETYIEDVDDVEGDDDDEGSIIVDDD